MRFDFTTPPQQHQAGGSAQFTQSAPLTRQQIQQPVGGTAAAQTAPQSGPYHTAPPPVPRIPKTLGAFADWPGFQP